MSPGLISVYRGGYLSLISGERGYPRSGVWGKGVPYQVTYPMIYVMLPTHPVNRHIPVKTLLPLGAVIKSSTCVYVSYVTFI